MPENRHRQSLRQSLLFHGVNERMIERALQRAHVQCFEAGTLIIRQGDPALAFHILTQGYAKLTQVTLDGYEIASRFLIPGDEFGVLSVLSGTTYPQTAQALDRCEVLVWAGEFLAQLMEQEPAIAFNGLRVMVERNQRLQQRYQELLTENVAQRLAHTLLSLLTQAGRETGAGTMIDIPFSEEDLAELTGTTVFSVSRILNHWQRNGWVQLGRKQIQVVDRQALEAITVS